MPIITEKKVTFPRIEIPAELIDCIGQLVSQGIVANIQLQQQVDGRPLKKNHPATRARKVKQGKPPISLVDQERRFIQKTSWPFTKTRSGGGWILEFRPGNAELRELSLSLQKRGYRGWFGVTKKVTALVRAMIQKSIKDLIARAVRQEK